MLLLPLPKRSVRGILMFKVSGFYGKPYSAGSSVSIKV